MSKAGDKKLWSGTATVLLIVTAGVFGLLMGVNKYLKDHRVLKEEIVSEGGESSIVTSPVLISPGNETPEQSRTFENGVSAINEEEWRTAQEAFESYISDLHGKRALARYFRGLSKRRNKDVKGAIVDYKGYLGATKVGESIYRVSAASELIYSLCQVGGSKNLQEAKNFYQSFEAEAGDADLERRTIFSNACWLVINQMSERERSKDPKAALDILELLFRPIAGIDATSDGQYLRNYFRGSRIWIMNEVDKKDYNGALAQWDKVKSKERYVGLMTDREERTAYFELKTQMEALHARLVTNEDKN